MIGSSLTKVIPAKEDQESEKNDMLVFINDHFTLTESHDVQEPLAGSPFAGSYSLGPRALKTANQVQGQHKYLIDVLKKSNICVEEHPSVSKPSVYATVEGVWENVHAHCAFSITFSSIN